MVLNWDNIKWFSDIVHLGNHFNCCLSFKQNTNLRKGQFIQCINEFVFAHPKCKSKLVYIYGSSFIDPICGIYRAKNLCLSVQHGM